MSAADERDAALAVIEQAKAEALKPSPVLAWSAITRIENVLNQSPTSALAKVKADALRKGASMMERFGDFRAATQLRTEADRIEKEATS